MSQKECPACKSTAIEHNRIIGVADPRWRCLKCGAVWIPLMEVRDEDRETEETPVEEDPASKIYDTITSGVDTPELAVEGLLPDDNPDFEPGGGDFGGGGASGEF